MNKKQLFEITLRESFGADFPHPSDYHGPFSDWMLGMGIRDYDAFKEYCIEIDDPELFDEYGDQARDFGAEEDFKRWPMK